MAMDETLSNQADDGEVANVAEASKVVPARVGGLRGWPHWTPYAAMVWSLVYAALGLYWAVGGRGFPYGSGPTPGAYGPIVGMAGLAVAWSIVIGAGIPAVVLGIAMLRGVRRFRALLITAGALLATILLLFTPDLTLLVMLAYIPFVVFKLLTGGEIGLYLQELTRSGWSIAHQLLCLAGGFLWLAATVSYARRSSDACPYCGRRDGPEGWTSPSKAARWGRIAVYVAMVAPIFYAVTRYAWALGIPLGMTEAYLRLGQESGNWTAGLFLANFGLVGAVLMLGLVQRWGEVFPRWMPGLGGRRVPMALAVVPASIISVLLIVGGLGIWSGYAQMAEAVAATGQDLWIVVGPTFLFPVWGAALAVATLGYYYRRRGPCGKCGRGASVKP
ncbi:MAG: hypothetical protein C3F13_09485 [Anaerolineales bacterium]|nr:MAG: hypothetical protein C3F13_09485 [Anaerolineales bacterium]